MSSVNLRSRMFAVVVILVLFLLSGVGRARSGASADSPGELAAIAGAYRIESVAADPRASRLEAVGVVGINGRRK